MKKSVKKRYYFDHAATTPLDKRVLKKMMPFLTSEFGNPSNLYEMGRKAGQAVAEATETITDILNCRPDEFVFTGSATEADNLAILGVARAHTKRVPLFNSESKGAPFFGRIIVSQIEHKGILAVCDVLRKDGFDVVELPVLKNGLVDLEVLKKSLTPETILVSITSADSETGTIQPIAEIAKIIRNWKIENSLKIKNFKLKIDGSLPCLHTDASQAAGYVDIDLGKLPVDLMTLSAHKLGGPKGIGGLYIRHGVNIEPIIYGGGQQGKLRSGTENVPGIVGFAEAIRLNNFHRGDTSVKIKKMRDELEKGIFKLIHKVVLNGHPAKRLPNFLNVSILDVEGEAMLLYLDALGIMVSTGSACNSQSLEPSKVLTALGNPYEFVHGSLRFTLGKENKMSDIKYVLKHLPAVVKKLRAMSPLDLKLGQTAKISNQKAFVGNQIPHFVRKSH